MADRDKYGNYVNDEGVTIKVSTDKNGNDHIGFYEGPVYEKDNHKGVHVNIDYEKGKWSSNTHDENHENPDSYSNSCFLTTACMKMYSDSFDDNCYELTTLRWFRDTYVSKDDIDKYYNIAPRIVKKIDVLDNASDVYEKIYKKVIAVCVKAIEDNEYDKAYKIYKDCIIELESKYM